MNLIILTKNDRESDEIYYLSDERFIHIKNILKCNIHDIIEVGLLNGKSGTARIIKLDNSSVSLEILQLNDLPPKSVKIDIVCALPRPQTLKKVLNICATMGVSNLHLIRSEKVEKSYFHSPLLDKQKYHKYLIEGLSQGKRTLLPNVTIHKKFKEFFNSYSNIWSNDTIKLLAHPTAENYLTKEIIKTSEELVIAIGPEGGWNEFEINYMKELGFIYFKISEDILRVETAVTSALAQIELLKNG